MKKSSWDYIYVAIQLILFVIYIIPTTALRFSTYEILKNIGLITLILGVLIGIISLLQLNKNLSPFPTPVSGSELIRGGAYKYIRHPIYTGILFALFGYGLHIGSGYKLIITSALLILFFFKSKYEEKKLTSIFIDYPIYKKRTGRFLPKLF